MKKLYYKNKLMIWLSSRFEDRRLFTPLRLAIYTLKDYGLWPQRLVALDAFCQTGLQWTRIFAAEAEYLEMWDIDEAPLKFARKEFPRAQVRCGDSIAAFKQAGFGRKDFNFINIDTPVPFRTPDGSFEHFGFFDDVFRSCGDRCVIIVDVVPYMDRMLERHPHPPEFGNAWAEARKKFYGTAGGAVVHPSVMTAVYGEKAKQAGYRVDLCTYNARNGYFGFITLAISK